MPNDTATEAKVAHVYRYVTQCATVDAFRVTPGEEVKVALYRKARKAVGMGDMILFVGEFSLDEALEFLKLESAR